jgi:hypothetical protein
MIWFAETFILVFVFVNLLVNIMTAIFASVLSTSESNQWKEKAGIMVENQRLLNRNAVFKNAKYIIVIE